MVMVTALDFNPRNADGSPASQAQLEQLNQAIRYLSQSPKAADLLQQAADKGVVIEFFSQMNGRYENGVISWNSEFSPKIKNSYTHETGYMSPALILLHEVVHSIDKQQGVDFIDIRNVKTDPRVGDSIPDEYTNDPYKIGMKNSWERFATEIEREIAKELGEPSRYLYSDVDIAFNPKSSKNEPVVNPNLSSVMDSARIFHQDGKLHEEISTGYNKAADGSVYSKELTVRDSQGQIERRLKTVFDENFQPINAVAKIYDYPSNTIKVGMTYFNPDKLNGQCEYQETFTDLQGKPKFDHIQSDLPHPGERLSPKAEKFFDQCKDKLINFCHEKGITADNEQDFTNIAMALTVKAMANKMTRIEKIDIDMADNLKIHILSREPHMILTSIEANEAVKIPAEQSIAKIQQIEQQFTQQEQQNQQQQYIKGRSI